MPNKRRAGQTFIGAQIDIRLEALLDRARRRKDRSQFIREAISEKLEGLGIHVPEDLIFAPDRTKVRLQGSRNNYSLNENEPGYGSKGTEKK